MNERHSRSRATVTSNKAVRKLEALRRSRTHLLR